VFHLSRELYLDLLPHLARPASRLTQRSILRACEAAISRMVAEPETAHRVGAWLFADVRHHFRLQEQAAVRRALDAHLCPLADDLRRSPSHARRLQRIEQERVTCLATKSDGSPCARWPAAGRDVCSAHLRPAAQIL
jgi:hypothetical protein